MKKNVAVIFGGRSVEHDVSIVTGLQLIENVNKEKYNVIPVYIARDGNWYTGEKLLDLKFMAKFDPADKSLNKAYIPPVSGVGGLVSEQKGGIFGKKQEVIPVDVVIPAMHGLNGEDGTLQGLLELANLPYTSAGVVGSSAGMDKILMKAAFKGADIPVLESTFLLRDEWKEDPEQVVARIENT
jgi:D-alanine-D-alanine ligase